MMYIVTNYHLKPLSPHIRHTAFVRKLLFFLVNICVFCNLSAQTLPLSGTILDEKEECIPGVYLIAVNPKTSEVLATTTSSTDGKYVLPTIPLPFILNATHIGYTSLNIPINNKTDMETARILRMQVAIEQLQEVVVTAEPPHIEREVGKFVIRNIAASPFATGSNTYNFLRFMPMIDIKPEGGISILGKNDANIHINGRSVGDNQMAEQMLKGIPANEIARIEIIPVTGSTQSAENRKGIINVVLKKKNGRRSPCIFHNRRPSRILQQPKRYSIYELCGKESRFDSRYNDLILPIKTRIQSFIQLPPDWTFNTIRLS